MYDIFFTNTICKSYTLLAAICSAIIANCEINIALFLSFLFLHAEYSVVKLCASVTGDNIQGHRKVSDPPNIFSKNAFYGKMSNSKFAWL